MEKVRTYERQGKLYAVCPDGGTDLNVWVWCQTCEQTDCPLAGKTPEDILQG